MLIIVILCIVIIISLILLWAISAYNKLQESIIRSNSAEADIDSCLRKRYDLLNKSINIIKATCNEEKILDNISNLRSKKLSNFDFDRELYESINEFNSFKEKYQELKTNDEFVKIDLSLHETEIEMSALRKYYNDIITDYNKYVKSFPSVLVAILFRYKKKPYYDGKNMDDKNTKDFRI